MLDGYLRRSEAIKLETKSRWGVGGKGGAKCVGRTVVKERSDGVQIKYKVLGGGGNALEGYLHNIWTKFNVLEGYLQGSKATKFWRIGA